MLCHAGFGSAFETSAVNPGFLNAAFSAYAAECPGTEGVKAAWWCCGGKAERWRHAGSNKLSQV